MKGLTICAISTAPGAGGIAVARVSGPDAVAIVSKVWRGCRLEVIKSHTAHLGYVEDPASGETLDNVVLTYFKSPNSYTGEDVIEISMHGSRWIQHELIDLLIRQGASMADRGEFTRRAVANGRLDLAEAEAVADMIGATSKAAQRIAISHLRGEYSGQLKQLRDQLVELAALVELELDFSEEDVEFADRSQLLQLAETLHQRVSSLASSYRNGRALKEGIPVAIAGSTNAGKSTLLNRLLHDDKAIVSDIHGTTRDTIEDTAEINGVLFRFIDTAGLRQTSDKIESIGIRRSHSAIANAAVVLWVVDPTADSPLIAWKDIEPNLADDAKVIAVINKSDLKAAKFDLPSRVADTISISALSDSSLNPLEKILTSLSMVDELQPALTVTNARHYEALTRAESSSKNIIEGLMANLPGDLLAQDIRETITHLSEITDPITTPTLLSTIFERFCIGK